MLRESSLSPRRGVDDPASTSRPNRVPPWPCRAWPSPRRSPSSMRGSRPHILLRRMGLGAAPLVRRARDASAAAQRPPHAAAGRAVPAAVRARRLRAGVAGSPRHRARPRGRRRRAVPPGASSGRRGRGGRRGARLPRPGRGVADAALGHPAVASPSPCSAASSRGSPSTGTAALADVVACAALVVGAASFSVGPIFAVAVAVELALSRRLPRELVGAGRAHSPRSPIAYVAYGDSGVTAGGVRGAAGWALDAAAAAAGGLAVLGPELGPRHAGGAAAGSRGRRGAAAGDTPARRPARRRCAVLGPDRRLSLVRPARRVAAGEPLRRDRRARSSCSSPSSCAGAGRSQAGGGSRSRASSPLACGAASASWWSRATGCAATPTRPGRHRGDGDRPRKRRPEPDPVPGRRARRSGPKTTSGRSTRPRSSRGRRSRRPARRGFRRRPARRRRAARRDRAARHARRRSTRPAAAT